MEQDVDAEIAEQLEIIRKANDRLSELIKKKTGPYFPWPTFPQYPPDGPGSVPFRPMPQWPMDELAPTCQTCGMKFTGPMGYVCPRGDCPSKITCNTIAK